MDPVVIGLAARPKRRLRYLAQAELWKIPGLGWFLNGMRQIPIKRGTGDSRALDRAVAALKTGDAVAVFPEGCLSWGERVRARSGIGLLAGWVPEARIVLCTIEGTTDYVRFPRRPRVTVRFLPPAEGGIKPGEEPQAFSARLLRELRERVPVTPAGRKPVIGGPPRVRRALARTNALTAEPSSSEARDNTPAS
jgi:1-acyl-sn-glycerol-3-phosphate acyltransferase